MTLGKLLNLSVPQFSHLPNSDKNTFLTGLLKRFNDSVSVKSREQCLAPGKHCASVFEINFDGQWNLLELLPLGKALPSLSLSTMFDHIEVALSVVFKLQQINSPFNTVFLTQGVPVSTPGSGQC